MSDADLFDLDLLAVLVSLGETGSFTETARVLERPQSSVSNAVRRLEAAAGRRLIDRTTRRVSLTTQGLEIARYARRVGEAAADARRRILQPTCGDVVRMGLFTEFSSERLPGVLEEFRRSHPTSQVRIDTARSDVLLSRFRDDALDLILVTRLPGHGLGGDCWRDELVWVGNGTVPSDGREPVPLAVAVPPSMMRRAGVQALDAAHRGHLVAFEANSYGAIAAAVRAGLGFGVFPRGLRPPGATIVAPPALPRLGHVEFVLLRTATMRRREIDRLHDLMRENASALLESAGAAMFGPG